MMMVHIRTFNNLILEREKASKLRSSVNEKPAFPSRKIFFYRELQWIKKK